MDPSDFTKWDPLNVLSLPLPAQNYDAGNFRAQRSAHAGLLLCWMSPEVEVAFPKEAQAFYAGFRDTFQRDVTVEDVRRYPTIGRGAYTAEEVNWCDATFDFLEGRLDEMQRARRNLPAKKRARRSASAAPAAATAAAATAAPSPAAAAAPRSFAGRSTEDETEDDEDIPLFPKSAKKRGRKAR